MKELLKEGKRIDGRDFLSYREISVKQGVIERAEGSAEVKIGETWVIAGVKTGVEKPFPDTPDEGILAVHADLLPLASEMFEPGPPDERSIELARVIDRGLRESCVELPQLCLIPGKRVVAVYVDISVLNHDGNLIDASALASVLALADARIPRYEVTDGEVERNEEEKEPLPLKELPIWVTFAKIDEYILLDPCLHEERIMDARLTIACTSRGICALQKGGPGFFTSDEIKRCIRTAFEKSKEIRELVGLGRRGEGHEGGG